MEIGDRKSALIHFGDGKPRRMTGKVVYIHPERRFYVLEFSLGPCRLRESYYFPFRGGDAP